ncbi:hypothetical protein BDZ89DRAFT_279634 [Hymenopellis radicata]|nr:hypothetical protein BDZ89DRAFT_279634 [Hymenopellis radicata]
MCLTWPCRLAPSGRIGHPKMLMALPFISEKDSMGILSNMTRFFALRRACFLASATTRRPMFSLALPAVSPRSGWMLHPLSPDSLVILSAHFLPLVADTRRPLRIYRHTQRYYPDECVLICFFLLPDHPTRSHLIHTCMSRPGEFVSRRYANRC